jgi:hypothetical protein
MIAPLALQAFEGALGGDVLGVTDEAVTFGLAFDLIDLGGDVEGRRPTLSFLLVL